MIFLIGIGLIVLGVISFIVVFSDVDGGMGWPNWVHVVFVPLIAGVPIGVVVALIGFGIWIGHPHVWRF